MNVEIKPYFATGERYPALIGVRADGDEYETAYVSKSELADAVRENAELRERLMEASEQVARHKEASELAELQIAELRRLVRGLYVNLSDLQRAICSSEDMWGYAKYYKECLVSAAKHMRELGVEAEG